MTARDVIAQALALSEAATDGPWELIGGGEYVTGVSVVVAPDDGGVTSADAEFISAARTLLPALAKALGDVLGEHRDVTMLDGSHVCSTCTRVHHDFGWPSVASEPFPCPTRTAITAALSEVTP